MILGPEKLDGTNMGDWNMLCTHQLLGAEIEQSQGHIHLDPFVVFDNRADFPNPSMHSVMPASGNTTNNFYQSQDHHDGSVFYASQYNHHQQPPALTLELGSVGPSNFYNMASSSSSPLSIPMANHILPSSNDSVMGVNYGRSHYFFDNYKRKNAEAEMVQGNCYHVGMPNSGPSSMNLSLNSGLQNWNKLSETEVNMMDVSHFTPPEFTGGLVQLTDGSQRSVRSRPNVRNLQMESTVFHHNNHLFQRNYVRPPFQPVGSAWIDQYGSNVSDGGSSTWNYAPAVPFLQGRSFSGGPVEIGNVGGHGQLETLNQNSAFLFRPPPLHAQHQHLPSLQGMHGQSYIHYPQVPAPSYGHPVNSVLHRGSTNPSRDSSVSRVPRSFPSSSAEWIHRSQRRLPQAVRESSDGHMRILLPEDVAVLEFSGFHGVGNIFDQHRDMRLDVDSMSYEELLALEEKIGVVNTGLSEEFILKNLRTIIYSATASSLSSQPSSIDSEDGTCIICQMEYEENERVGTLHCGHNYHEDCIKQWLLVKNLCPICKALALVSDRREG